MRILVANFFPAFHPPRSGGEQRYYYLYHYLSRHFDITLLSPTYSNVPFEVVEFGPTFREYRVPKEALFDYLHWALDARGIGPECSGYVVSLAASANTEYGEHFRALAEGAELIIHESPFTLPYDRTLGADGKPRIYNAYNVEAKLAAQVMVGEAGEKAVEFIRFLEQSLVDSADMVFVTSTDEREAFVTEFGFREDRTVLVPNGFEPVGGPDVESVSTRDGGNGRVAIFMGSAHPPNVEAALFILELASELRDIEFRLMGAVCKHLPSTLPPNVKSLGFVDEPEKWRQLAGCGAALNPLFSGAGTNLKMLDYMAAGAPIVATSVGARGLGLKDGVDVHLADLDRYSKVLRATLDDPVAARVLGAAAKRKAFGEYTWERIAEGALSAIRAGCATRFGAPSNDVRRSILVVNDFPVAEATGGGQVRIRELLIELSREFNVRLLCFAQGAESSTYDIAPGLDEIRIAKTAAHREAELRAGRGAAVSVSDLVASEHCATNPEFMEFFVDSVRDAAAVIFEHPYLAPLVDLVPSATPVVYSALNVEAELKAETLRPRRDFAARLEQVTALEEKLLRRAALVICVSEQDSESFARRFPEKRYEVIENGAGDDSRHVVGSLAPAKPDPGHSQFFAVFMGSSHFPNIEAALYLRDEVAPTLPDIPFVIVGSVCDAIGSAALPANFVLLGVLEQDEKNALLAHAAVAVNPMFQGGGSSLKVPDFFAAGLALVSTRLGVRGYEVRDGDHYLEAERSTFPNAIRRLALDEPLRKRLAANGRAYGLEKLSWTVLGARYRKILGRLVEPGAKRRLLVVTYRFADPPPGGAESYLVNVLRELSLRGHFIVDVATCDVGDIRDKWHFSAEYDPPAVYSAAPSYLHSLFRFPVDRQAPETLDRCKRLFRLWMSETRTQSSLLEMSYDRPSLLGGWNFPERYAGNTSRWTSGESQIYVGAGATAIHLVGFSPHEVRVDLWSGDVLLASKRVNGKFEIRSDLRGGHSVLAIRTDRCFDAPDDPRELGFVLYEASVQASAERHAVDLTQDFEGFARARDSEAWVKSLMMITQRRDLSDDELFCKVRGPHSAGLDGWLEANASSYDVILAQGTPFSTPVKAAEVAKRRGVPIVLLPHYHMEDRYYHWQEYYASFRDATSVIGSPETINEVFLGPLGARGALAPGGGVNLGEYSASKLAECSKAFRKIHPDTNEFVLVLGRKAGGKNYQAVIEAIQSVNARGRRADVVLIGPDEDRIAITVPHTHCYGAQPRDVVLGALSLSLCLVNMSFSESFGIVLLESWLAGRPVVAQEKCMAFRDLVEHGQNGLLEQSSTDVAMAVERYLAEPLLALRHAQAGKRIAEEYGWPNVAARIESILLDAVADKSDPGGLRTSTAAPQADD